MMNNYEYWLTLDSETRAELEAITDKAELEDRFYKELKFGTGGMRGVMGAGANRMNKYTVARATKGLADMLLTEGGGSVAIAYVVPGEEDGGHAQLGAAPAVEHELRAHLTVEPHFGGGGGIGVGQGVARAAGGGVIAHKHGGVKGLVHPIDHGIGVTAPVAHHLDALRQLGPIQVAPGAVGVLDHDLGGPGGDGALAGGLDLPGHLLGKGAGLGGLVDGMGLIPTGGEGRPLDVSGNEYLHRTPSFTSRTARPGGCRYSSLSPSGWCGNPPA